MAFFPTQPESAEMQNITDVAAWVGVDTSVITAVETQTGNMNDQLRNLALLPGSIIRAAVAAARLPASGSTPERGLTPVQAAHVGLVWRIASRKAHGWDTWVDVDPLVAPVAPSAPVSSTPSTPGDPLQVAKKLKMSAILDQGDDSEFASADAEKIKEWFGNYLRITHGQPEEEETPTNEQLTALGVRVLGQAGSPYADFAVFTPFARKTARAHKYTAYLPQPDGTWLAREVPGPRNYDAWLYCWRVFRVACLMLKIAHEMPLDRYQRKIERLATQWPTAWHLVALAEDKCRFEHMNRVKAKVEFEITLGRPTPPLWDVSAPWSAIFLKVAADDEAYWDENVRHPAMAWLAHGSRGAPRPRDEIVADVALAGGSASLAPYTGPPQAPAAAPGETRQTRRARHRRENAERARASGPYNAGDGRGPKGTAKGSGKKGGGKGKVHKYVQDVSRKALCFSWNAGRDPCRDLGPGSACPNGRIHKCTNCRSEGHPARNCPDL